jgi:Fur family zinc uptake transcriptional regulator
VGLVHRFESRNAFFACHIGHEKRQLLVLACETCGRVAEVDGDRVFGAIDTAASAAAFAAKDAVIEVWGECVACATGREPAHAAP